MFCKSHLTVSINPSIKNNEINRSKLKVLSQVQLSTDDSIQHVQYFSDGRHSYGWDTNWHEVLDVTMIYHIPITVTEYRIVIPWL